ncbi:MAG: DUF2398 family protein [Deltaproteobacteria bacterium]|nr:DUF2398 family protein [Deltaproteobacteria bacterium]
MNDIQTDTTPTGESTPLDRLSRVRSRRILNCLTESTFFYRQDDRDLFDYLRRNRAAFQHFFEEHFGWDLFVDRKVARLFRAGAPTNPALTPRHRSLFDLTRRDQAVGFMLLLEFHELSLAAQNVHPEHDEDLRFLLSDFLTHAVARYRKVLGEAAPTDREILAATATLFRELERHRFLELIERGDDEGGELQELWAFLPGIRCYEPSRLAEPIIRRAHGLPEPEETAEAPESLDAFETPMESVPAGYGEGASTPHRGTTARLLEPGDDEASGPVAWQRVVDEPGGDEGGEA